MKDKTSKFIEELKSWRQEDSEKRSFSLIVTDRENTLVVAAEGDSTALASAALSYCMQKGDTDTLTHIIETGIKANYVIDNMDDFLDFTKNNKS